MLYFEQGKFIEYTHNFVVIFTGIISERGLVEDTAVDMKSIFSGEESEFFMVQIPSVANRDACCNDNVVDVGRLDGKVNPVREIFTVKNVPSVFRFMLGNRCLLYMHTPETFVFCEEGKADNICVRDIEEPLDERREICGDIFALE